MTNIQQAILCLVRQIEQDYKIYAYCLFNGGKLTIEFYIDCEYTACGTYACKIDDKTTHAQQRHIFVNLQRLIEGIPANTMLDQKFTIKK